jgi:hypothetical protein
LKSTNLTALLKRQSEIKAAVRDERERRRLQAAKEKGRLASIVGHALLKAAEHPDFELMLRGVLKTTIPDESPEAKFLKTKGWL